MEINEIRVIIQEWYETNCTKTGWDSNGWIFKDDRLPIDNSWEITKHLDSDKHYNPIVGIAEKKTLIF